MIKYDGGSTQFLFLWTLKGSVIPSAALYALPSALVSLTLQLLMQHAPDILEDLGISSSMHHSVVWSVLTTCLGFCIVFRTNQAYGRFWEGTTLTRQMRAEWWYATSNVVAFSKKSLDDDTKHQDTLMFHHVLVRLVSYMHGLALKQIAGADTSVVDSLDIHALDNDTLGYLASCEERGANRVEVIIHWINILVTENLYNGVIQVPPPILTRVYQEFGRGMVMYNNARKIAETPFPFAYAQLITFLLLAHTLLTPFAIATAVENAFWAPVFSFLAVLGFWGLNFIATQLEQPFGEDANDLPLGELQEEMNVSLRLLLEKDSNIRPDLRETKKEALRHDPEARKTLKQTGLRRALQESQSGKVAANVVGVVPCMQKEVSKASELLTTTATSSSPRPFPDSLLGCETLLGKSELVPSVSFMLEPKEKTASTKPLLDLGKANAVSHPAEDRAAPAKSLAADASSGPKLLVQTPLLEDASLEMHLMDLHKHNSAMPLEIDGHTIEPDWHSTTLFVGASDNSPSHSPRADVDDGGSDSFVEKGKKEKRQKKVLRIKKNKGVEGPPDTDADDQSSNARKGKQALLSEIG